MMFSREEFLLMMEALKKAKSQSETNNFETEKQILDNYEISTNENFNSAIQGLYDRLLKKIESVMEELKNE